MVDPAISVIIPHLNQHEALRRCLVSLAAQTFDAGKFEIIIVDNGSSQLPTEICAAFKGVKLDEEPDPGPGPARNRGAGLARGSILAFIDADCVADPEWLAVIAATLAQDSPTRIIGGDVRIDFVDPTRLTMLEAYECIYAYRQQDYIERQGFSGTGNLAMQRTAYDEVGPFGSIDVAEDREWGQRATAMGYRIGYVPGMIVFHPARRNFTELCAKWDRHVAHDFVEKAGGVKGRTLWIVRTIAMVGSPVVEYFRIPRSLRVKTWRARFLAAVVITRIRLYRAMRMTEHLVKGDRAARAEVWNRE